MASISEKNKNYNTGIRSYHEIGPLADLSDSVITTALVDSVAERLLPEVVSPREKILQWQKNILNPAIYMNEVNDPTVARDIVSAYKDIGDACEMSGQLDTARMLYEASLVVAGSRLDKPSSIDLLATNESKDWLLARGYSRVGVEVVAQSVEKRRTEVLNKILSERRVKDGGLRDGPAFEMALMSILQYDLYSQEKEDKGNFTRMARTREDMPAPGMAPEKGTRVAHDVVYVYEGVTYRVQTKFGPDTTLGYDESKVVLIEELGMDRSDLNRVFTMLVDAYHGDPDASNTILVLAEKYKSRILGSRQYAASKVLDLVTV